VIYFRLAWRLPGFIIRPVRSRISAKRAYIKGCPEMTCAGAPPSGGPARSVRDLESRSH